MWDAISPLDHRYRALNEELFNKLSLYLSESASIKYFVKVEIALLETLSEYNICPPISLKTVNLKKILEKIDFEEIYEEELRIEHNIRAVVNYLMRRLPQEYRKYVHLFATSFDIIDTARALQYKEFTTNILIEELRKLLLLLIDISRKYAATIQIGRTHGRFAEPITFGHFIANYLERLGERTLKIKEVALNLRGKFSGPVGAFNSLSLTNINPLEFEKRLLNKISLKPSDSQTSTQIVHPEYLLDFIYSVISAFGVLANLADDLRNLSRSEIDEIEIVRKGNQTVGSSTMPHKVNPKDFENIKSLWKVASPRIITLLMDQISEHQRDLTNSASARFIPEILALFTMAVNKTYNILSLLSLKEEKIKQNFEKAKREIIAEPIYILLALKGHPEPYNIAKKIVPKITSSNQDIMKILSDIPELKTYIEKFSEDEISILRNPEKYIGKSKEVALNTCQIWEERISTLKVN